jgi:hypothetical protein
VEVIIDNESASKMLSSNESTRNSMLREERWDASRMVAETIDQSF